MSLYSNHHHFELLEALTYSIRLILMHGIMRSRAESSLVITLYHHTYKMPPDWPNRLSESNKGRTVVAQQGYSRLIRGPF